MSWQWWEQDVLHLEGEKNISAAYLGGEKAKSEEEGLAQEETTGRERGQGVLSSNLTQ